MKAVWKIVLIIVQAIIIVISGNFGLTANKKYQSEAEKSARLETAISELNKDFEQFELKLNDTVKVLAAQADVFYVRGENYKELYREQSAIVKKLGFKVADLNSQTNLATVVKDTVYVPTVQESNNSYTAKYADGFADINCNVNATESKISYSYTDSLQVYDYRKRKSILWGLIRWQTKDNKVVVFSKNPKSRIGDVDVIKIIE